MVHVGFEPSAVLGANRNFPDTWKLLKWQLTNPRSGQNGTQYGAGYAG